MYINCVYGSGVLLLLNELCFLKIMLLCAISSHLTIYIQTHTQTFICFYALFCISHFSIHKSYTLNNINLHFLILMYFYFSFGFRRFVLAFKFLFFYLFFFYLLLSLSDFYFIHLSLFKISRFIFIYIFSYLFVFQSKWKKENMKMIFTHLVIWEAEPFTRNFK